MSAVRSSRAPCPPELLLTLTHIAPRRRRLCTKQHPWYAFQKASVPDYTVSLADYMRSSILEGYKVGAAKTVDEYANLDAEDESLARWKASLGIVPGAASPTASGPQVTISLLISLATSQNAF